MSTIGQIERRTQERVIQLFTDQLGYTYLGNWEYRVNNANIEEALLRDYLQQQGWEDALIDRTIYELTRTAGDQSRDLYYVNKDVYTLLRYGVRVLPEVGQNHITIPLIDWKNPLNNHFAIAEEVTVLGQHVKRPDIVLYINGIALGVLELKRSVVSVGDGIRQNILNQRQDFIRPFFTTMQLIMAGNDTEGLRYGSIDTPEKYYLAWKEATRPEVSNRMDRELLQLCEKRRFLEIIHNFIVFDGGIKKLCRHNQYFGVKAAQERMRRREGGIIWHTQGSGKSLTMVWLAKWLRENIAGARVLIVTDRKELDEQIDGVFTGVDESITRTTSGADLIDKLNAAAPWLLCSLVHKFGSREEVGFAESLRRSLPPGFSPKGELFVFVDECHRTQSGELHKAMKAILPNAVFVGFTGTPLLRADKQRSIEVFGSYIHTYKFDEAVADNVVLDLRYEARDIDQHLGSQEKIDQWFEAKTRGLNDVACAQLKQKWGTMQKVLSSRERLEKIVADVLLDMETKPRLMSQRGNALLVCDSIYQACRVYEMFRKGGLNECAIITSYVPNTASISAEITGEGETEKAEQYETYQRMLNGKTVEAFEKDVKHKFVHEPGLMRLLIVVDKLLTGFDAPPATYLYIDKQMRDHGLFQAICRVNRLDGEDKDYGYIVDYKNLFQSLETSVIDYTSGALDGYEADDVAGLLKDRLEKARERLEEAREAIKALCEPVEPPKDTQAFIHYFCGSHTADPDALKDNEPKRVALYKHAVALIRAHANIANEMAEAGYTPEQAEQIQREVDYYEKVRTEIKLASGDYIDLKVYEPAMRALLDTYVRADDSEKVSVFDELSLIQLIVQNGPAAVDQLPEGISNDQAAVAETIENNMRRLIIDEQPMNPKYYEKMSALLDALILERRSGALAYQHYLEKITELARQVQDPTHSQAYPPSLNTQARRAFYDNLGQDLGLAVALDEQIQAVRQDNWRDNKFKRRLVWNAIYQCLNDEQRTHQAFELALEQKDY